MAVTKRPRASAGAHRRAAAASDPCCPNASDLVVLAMANPMFTGGFTRGLRRIRSDGTSISQRVRRALRLRHTEGQVPRRHRPVLLFGLQPTADPRQPDELVSRNSDGLQLRLAAEYFVRHQPNVFE